MGVVVGLERVPGSSTDRCEHFIGCLYDRLYGEDDQRQIDVAAPDLPFIADAIDFTEAKRLVAAAASECDPNWRELYGFPPDTSS